MAHKWHQHLCKFTWKHLCKYDWKKLWENIFERTKTFMQVQKTFYASTIENIYASSENIYASTL